MNKAEQALQDLGIDTREDNGSIRPLMDILDDLSIMWDEVEDRDDISNKIMDSETNKEDTSKGSINKDGWKSIINKFPSYGEREETYRMLYTNALLKYQVEDLLDRLRRAENILILSEDKKWAESIISIILTLSDLGELSSYNNTEISYKTGHRISWKDPKTSFRGHRFSGMIIDSRYPIEDFLDYIAPSVTYVCREFTLLV